MKRIRIWTLLLALTMLLGTPVRASEPVLPQQEHLELSMAELETCHFDLEAFRSLCGDIQAQCTDRDNLEAVEALVQELRRDYLLMDTELTLCSLNISKHAADAAAQEVYLDLSLIHI